MKAWRFGDNVSTDAIIPGKHRFHITDLRELAKHAMEGADPAFASKVSKGDIVVAGDNFGCGSSREHAPRVLKLAGVSAVIAKSFARIFYRNAINVGLPVLECADADDIAQGDELEIDLEKGTILDRTRNKALSFSPFPKMLIEMLRDGGLVEHYKKRGKFAWE